MRKYRSFIFPFDELTDGEKEALNVETSPEKGGNKEDKNE